VDHPRWSQASETPVWVAGYLHANEPDIDDERAMPTMLTGLYLQYELTRNF